ncbi:hemagglutinin repeat-containing protein [Neisseria leonii]|uniref:hemagglutinin repeat-containing protein n=1 Tax=Neisseria leonii TaxID=2995413 RepID=UPI00237BCEE9|nr:hemagglutinin repeat-containing protein [Neisseria sp. 3986]MDD9324814.1 hemagglutinin repeat-containing protein [Neisseria sp. 3986]
MGAADEYELLNMLGESKRSGVSATVNVKAAEVRQMEKFVADAQKSANESGAQNRVRAWGQGHLAGTVEPIMPTIGMTRNCSNVSETRHTITPKGTTVNAGGKVAVKAAAGDVNIIGSQVYGVQNTWIDAFRDVNIVEAAQNNESSLQSRSKTSGLMDNGAFNHFIGNKIDLGREHSATVTCVGSGHTEINADRNYTQRGSKLLADGNIGVAAQNIRIDASESKYHSDYYRRHTPRGHQFSCHQRSRRGSIILAVIGANRPKQQQPHQRHGCRQ